MRLIRDLFGLTVLTYLLTACSGIIGVEQNALGGADDVLLSLQAGNTIGQTFVAHQSGLAGVEFYLSPETLGAGTLLLQLKDDPRSSVIVASATLSLASVAQPGYYRFDFEPQADSRQHYYAAILRLDGEGSVQINSAPGPMYLDGAAYLNTTPLDAQTAFHLIYAPPLALLGMVKQILTWGLILGASVLLYVLPGWGVVSRCWPRVADLWWAERLGLAIGVSLAVYPILFLWTAALHLGPWYAWLPAVLGLASATWEARRWREWRERFVLWRHSLAFWPDVALLGVVTLIFATRFWSIRQLDLPLWGDSYHHTLIAQLLVDHNGLFDNWQPYAELTTLTYHFGFQALVAVFHWFTGLATSQSVLWVGQVLNGLAAIVLYPLASRISRQRWAGVAAVLVAGLLTPMPAGYVNWGRYTQLTGQVILPVVILGLWAATDDWRFNKRLAGMLGVLFGGLALTHYRVLMFAVLALPILWGVAALEKRGRVLIPTMALAGGLGGVIFLPWLWHMFAGRILDHFFYQLAVSVAATPSAIESYNTIGSLSNYLTHWQWVLLLTTWVWGLWRRNWAATTVSAWSGMVLLAANPQWLGLPGQGLLSNFAVFIAAYIPAAVLIGGAVGWIMERWPSLRWLHSLAPLMVAISLGLFGARQRLGEINRAQGTLATRPDLNAATWMREHLPADARLLVNSFFAYGDTVIVGGDGGWWLPVLARRQTTLPPLTYDTEQGPRPDYVEWVNALPRAIQKNGLTAPTTQTLLAEYGVTHVYIGQRHGGVNYDGPSTLQPAQLLSSPFFREIYHQDLVWIFEISR